MVYHIVNIRLYTYVLYVIMYNIYNKSTIKLKQYLNDIEYKYNTGLI